jgi:hypothetical protein
MLKINLVFYIDGGIHANEMQGVEVAMHTARYLAESFQTIKFINTLLKEKVFYIVNDHKSDGRKFYL